MTARRREPGNITKVAVKSANLFTQADDRYSAGTVIALRRLGLPLPALHHSHLSLWTRNTAQQQFL